MLVDFEVKNFLSFKNSTLLSMERGKYLKKYSGTNTFDTPSFSLLKNIIIFGGNGSGKSNLFLALQVLRDMIINSTDDIEDQLPYMPFKLDNNSEKKPITFSTKFVNKGKTFHYTISYILEEVMFEELSTINKRDIEEVYFRRTYDKENEIIPDNLATYRSAIRRNKLFLFEGQDKNDENCSIAFNWFHSKLVFEKENKRLFKIIADDEYKKNVFIKLLNLADFNIIDIEINEKKEKMPEELANFMSMMVKSELAPRLADIPNHVTSMDVFSVYKKYDNNGNVIGKEKIAYDMESAGTKKMMSVALTLLHSLHKDRVIIMDEFDDSFHLSLTRALLKIINSEVNTNQFVFTSHNLNLLDSDLRVDQIYLSEKDFLGVTELFSLFDFNDIKGVARNDISFAKRYLEGQFGALPDIDLEGMKQLFERM